MSAGKKAYRQKLSPAGELALANIDAVLAGQRYIKERVQKLSLTDMQRLVAAIDGLAEDQLEKVLAFAEGLAAWSCPDA